MSTGQPVLVIGCPVYRREWIITQWYEHAVRAADELGVRLTFVLVGDPGDTTFDVLRGVLDHGLVIVPAAENPDGTGERGQWTTERIRRMVDLRNLLLGAVRTLKPDFFLSLDSDILLNPQALVRMVKASETWDAVGSKAYMEPTESIYPSYSLITGTGAMYRPDAEGTFRVDVIMAIKLMTPLAYEVDYGYHQKGEDFGWSIRARESGVRLGWDGGVCSKHVMCREHLARVDERCGY